MSTVLVTGGTGNLGRHVSWALLQRGHTVRALTHRSKNVTPGAEAVSGDVVSGKGIAAAVDGVDAVIHTATRSGRRAMKTEVGGTRTVADASARVGAHFVYPSIVGVDRHRLSYYDAKWEAEQLVEDSNARWTILRATQFHDLIEQMLSAPVCPTAPGWTFQPVDVGEVATRLVDLVEAEPCGRATDFGGPELLGVGTLAQRRHQITGRRSRLIRVPRVGSVADFVHGLHLCPLHRDGTITWDQWLQRRDGDI